MVAGTAEEGADTLVWLATAGEVASTSGAYFYRRRPHRSSPASRNVVAQDRLWRVSEALTALRPTSSSLYACRVPREHAFGVTVVEPLKPLVFHRVPVGRGVAG